MSSVIKPRFSHMYQVKDRIIIVCFSNEGADRLTQWLIKNVDEESTSEESLKETETTKKEIKQKPIDGHVVDSE